MQFLPPTPQIENMHDPVSTSFCEKSLAVSSFRKEILLIYKDKDSPFIRL
jgi:hypothetical protein